MNWTKIYRRIPDRVRIGIAGLVLAIAFVTSPRIVAWWLSIWS